ncbi:MAG: hypothetical protein GX067_08025 [Clostridiales bacterium]|nr:hypothetical protein [Clostridiales bacterium]
MWAKLRKQAKKHITTSPTVRRRTTGVKQTNIFYNSNHNNLK